MADENMIMHPASGLMLDEAAQQIAAETEGVDAESQLDFMAVAAGDPKVYS